MLISMAEGEPFKGRVPPLPSGTRETIDKMNDNININNLANDDLNNYKVFVNEYNSCSFD